MAIVTGTVGDDSYVGTVGIFDTGRVRTRQSEAVFTFDSFNWTLTSTAGVDTLFSIDRVELDDALFKLTLGGETRVNTTTSFEESSSQTTLLSNGNYVVAWHSSGADGSGYGIYSQMYNAAGERIGGETRVNTATANSQNFPVIEALGDGGYVIAWNSYAQDGSVSGIYLQRFDGSGAAVGTEMLVNAFTAGDQISPAIASLADGGFVVTWQSAAQDGSGNGIYFQRFDANGAKIGGEVPVNTYTIGEQTDPGIVTLDGGGFVVSWESVNQDGSGLGVYFQRYNAAGSPVGTETLVNTTTSGSQADVALAALDDGGFVAVWHAGATVLAQRFDASGGKIDGETTIGGNAFSASAAVTALADGGYVVVWTMSQFDSMGGAVVAQRYDAEGAKVGDLIQVNTYETSDQHNPSVSPLSDGGFVVAWDSYFQDGASNGVYSQRFDANGEKVLPTIAGDDYPNFIEFDGGNPVRLEGAGGNDALWSGTGDDVLDGGAGRDTLRGGAGDDTYIADPADRIVELANGGTDTARVTTSYTITSPYLENVELVGNAAASLIGNGLDNLLTGNGSDNILNGGQGADEMVGGGGNDTYFVEDGLDPFDPSDTPDVVIEQANAGLDTVVSEIDYTLGANVEILRLIGSEALDGTGNAGDNQLIGNNADNRLVGGGGADMMIGDAGDDTYVVDADDDIMEDANAGTDSVQASASWMLGDNLENLILLAGGDYNATGNELRNVLIGNSSSNVLDGRQGSDTMDGGAGDDIYIVDNSRDVASEGGTSTDLVKATVSHALGNGIENLILMGGAKINGIGNGLDNVIRGNSVANNLNGHAGIDALYGGYGDDRLVSEYGGDRLLGGVGDDSYVVNGETDDIVELGSQGTDTVIATVSRSYTLGLNLEDLVLKGGHVAGYGNSDANRITGTGGNNLLDGAAGDDRMTGLAGNDTYVVDSRSDLVFEAAGAGTDRVLSSVTTTLRVNVENLVLTGSDALNGVGNTLRNRLSGNDAANTLRGDDGNDALLGGAGRDLLYGDAGNDTLKGGIANDRLDGGAGTDLASYYSAASGVRVLLGTTAAQDTLGAGIDTLIGIERLDGSNVGGDNLVGNNQANRIRGFGGDDMLRGGSGNDALLGGEGDDVIVADPDNDVIDGGNGFDRVNFSQVNVDITVDLNLTIAQETGIGRDKIVNVESVTGSDGGNDRLTGDYQDNSLFGLGGTDVLQGGEGHDDLFGGKGFDTADYSMAWDSVNVDLALGSAFDDGSGYTDTLNLIENLIGSEFDDVLSGNGGRNELTGGIGRDVLEGKAGDDTFVYRSIEESGTTSDTRDIIRDFASGDRIDLSMMDANQATAIDENFTTLLGANQAFTAAGQLRFEDGILYGNTDADGGAEFAIRLIGVNAMTMTDFIF